MTESDTIQIIKDFIKNYKEWAMTQHSDNSVREWMRVGWVNNIETNVYSQFTRNSKDQIYWLNRCSDSFQEKFKTTMPDELKYKLFLINLIIN
jgi:hypothetical protein